MLTEQQNERSRDLDTLTTEQMLEVINDEDAKVHQVVRSALPAIAQAVDAAAAALRRGGRIIYVGAGTSGRLGVLDAVECIPTFSATSGQVVGLIAGGHKALTQAVEGAEDDGPAGAHDLENIGLTKDDIVIGIAASGRTPYVIGALNYATEHRVKTVGIACNVPSTVLDSAQIKIALPVGPEVIAGSTRMKAGTAQKMVLNMISTGVFVKLGKVYGNLMVDVQVTNAKLQERAIRIVMQVSGADEITARRLLNESANNPKLAIVMHKRQVDAPTARRLLGAANGRLRVVLDAGGVNEHTRE